MMHHDTYPSPLNRQRLARISGALALSTLMLSGCDNAENVPSHTVVVQEGQTLDDIGRAECGISFLNMTIHARRNQLRNFNDLPDNSVTTGQVIQVPDSLCYDTGDISREDGDQPR